ALGQNVIIATPSTLIALLKAVAYGWRQAAVAHNAALIRDLGQELYRRLATFNGHLGRTGQRLATAVEAYHAAVGSPERHRPPAPSPGSTPLGRCASRSRRSSPSSARSARVSAPASTPNSPTRASRGGERSASAPRRHARATHSPASSARCLRPRGSRPPQASRDWS